MRLALTQQRKRVPFIGTFAAIASVLVMGLLGPGTVANATPARNCECATPSIDRLQQWIASGEGTTVPATGSLLVREGSRYTAKVEFLNVEWHVVVVWLANQFEAQVDLGKSSGFWMTYSATDDLYVQLRPASHWSGGDKWLTLVPSTGGKVVRKFFSFSPNAWMTLPELGTPSYSFASALREARGFVFVGKTPNKLQFRGLHIDGYRPPCL
ncbi:hypothetical protein SAMN05661093_01163 [Kibdelosporangium aridum]|uniref:Uncharacterized protein n=2 Tax=Kibdelosporangium aridum TaxID=2030 RepID=A0A1W2AWM9_KIBAR|nr:hypothetical protein [Kibdelosporangium aridum]SMC65147.1 hypothetical protein SAMN05661093_01163 [Kibdelosporangium aridum]